METFRTRRPYVHRWSHPDPFKSGQDLNIFGYIFTHNDWTLSLIDFLDLNDHGHYNVKKAIISVAKYPGWTSFILELKVNLL